MRTSGSSVRPILLIARGIKLGNEARRAIGGSFFSEARSCPAQFRPGKASAPTISAGFANYMRLISQTKSGKKPFGLTSAPLSTEGWIHDECVISVRYHPAGIG